MWWFAGTPRSQPPMAKRESSGSRRLASENQSIKYLSNCTLEAWRRKQSINSLRWSGKGFSVDVTLANFILIPRPPLAVDRECHFPSLSMTVCFPSLRYRDIEHLVTSGWGQASPLGAPFGTTVPSGVVKQGRWSDRTRHSTKIGREERERRRITPNTPSVPGHH